MIKIDKILSIKINLWCHISHNLPLEKEVKSEASSYMYDILFLLHRTNNLYQIYIFIDIYLKYIKIYLLKIKNYNSL